VIRLANPDEESETETMIENQSKKLPVTDKLKLLIEYKSILLPLAAIWFCNVSM
jgi:hypothetical protein